MIMEKSCDKLENFCQEIRSTMSETEWTNFTSQKTDIGRLELLQGKDKIKSYVFRLLELYPTRKDKSISMRLKDFGNTVFSKEDYQQASHLYSKALIWMPHGHEETDDVKDASILYANRSAALFHQKEFELTHQDAELAFSLNYPPQLHYKLYERLAKCSFSLGDTTKAKQWIQKAIQALDNSTLTELKMKKMKESFEELSANFKDVGTNTYKSAVNHSGNLKYKVVGGTGKYLRNASKRLSLKYEENQGRFVVANEKLIPGDIILVEKPYTSALLPEHYHRQCFHCFDELKAPIPCQYCIYASYCSKNCRDEAWYKHHKNECKILGVLKQSKLSPSCYMALRMLTQSDPNEVCQWYDLALATEENPNRLESNCNKNYNKSKRRNRKRPDAISENETPNSKNQVYKTDHESILLLCKHPTLTEDYLYQVVASLYLLEALKTTLYFSNFPQTDDKKWEMKFALILLRCLQSLPYNAHSFDWESSSADSYERIEYACGLFPTLSLFNHSCYPSVVRYMVKDTVIVRVIRNILPGEQVTENYGQHFMTAPKAERQAYLSKNYCFQCNCQPCQENWGDFETLAKQEVLCYRCEHCNSFICKSNERLPTKCPKCSKPLHILESLQSTMEMHDRAEEFVKNGDLEKGLEVLLQNISLLDTYLISPVNDLHVYQEHARMFFRNFGNSISKLPVWDPLDCRFTKN